VAFFMEQRPDNTPESAPNSASRSERFRLNTIRRLGNYSVGAGIVASGFATYLNLTGEHVAAGDISTKGLLAMAVGIYALNRADAWEASGPNPGQS
jgi:hypothetical protein